jgi:ABC-type amino acid transport substrate-binding protein
MIMKKKLVSVLMTAVMAAAMVTGCGGTQEASGTSEAAGSSETAGTTEAATGTAGTDDSDAPACKDALAGVTLVVGTSGTYAPFSYFAEDGVTLQGYDVDFLNALQEVLGFEIADGTIQDMDYGPLGTSLSQGQLDIGAAALCATDERKKSMNFTNIYYDAGIIVAVAVDNDTITGVDDLTGGDYVVAVQTGTIAYEYAVANLPESCLQAYDSQALAYKAVEDGQADATIYDLPGTAYSISTGEVNLKVVGDEFYTGQAPYALALSFAICEQYPDIVDEFNEAIAYLQETGKLDEFKAKWCE